MIVDSRHALFVGWVVAKAQHHGLNLEPIRDDDGVPSNELRLLDADGEPGPIILVVPCPADDWRLEAEPEWAEMVSEMQRLAESVDFGPPDVPE